MTMARHFKRKRIWIVNHSGGSPYHGPNMRSYYLARNLAKEGYDVSIISSSFFHKYFCLPIVEDTITYENINGVRFCWVRTCHYEKRGFQQVLNQLQFVFRLLTTYQDLNLPQPNFVIASSPHPFVSLPANRIAKRFKAKLIFEIRDLWPLLVKQLGGFSSLHPYILSLRVAEKYSCTTADHIVSVKPGDFEYLRKAYNIPESKFTHIPNGFDETEVLQHKINEEISSMIPKGKFIIGYVGSFGIWNAMESLILSAEKIKKTNKNIHFVLVGDGSEKSKLLRLAEEKNLKNITFLPAMEKKFVLDLINRFDVAYVGLRKVAATQYGISCNKIYEYMYAGKPILAAYNTHPCYDPVRQSGCGFTVSAESAKEISKKVLEFYDLPKYQPMEMGQNGKNYLIKYHTYDKISDLYIKCLENLVDAGD